MSLFPLVWRGGYHPYVQLLRLNSCFSNTSQLSTQRAGSISVEMSKMAVLGLVAKTLMKLQFRSVTLCQ